ncbi:MAG: MCE family protein [Acetobacteraceae bacterium]|nr:MCE family protein [Acetobacteraceae bacterium]
MSEQTEAPEARVRARRVSPIWLIPLLAAAVAAYLIYNTLSSLGPQITITFETGEGLVAGQTKVQHKAVTLGTVQSVRLADRLRQVRVTVQMEAGTGKYLTDRTRFWVVRPRFAAGQVSGLETLVSGSYIDFDPGLPGGKPQDEFTGLAEPPRVRADEPGRSYTVTTNQTGPLSSGSPVLYRGIPVGEVLGHDQPAPGHPTAIHIFVRAPYDTYVREGTHFWNASGVSVQFGGGGLHLQVESLQALLGGGIAFDTPAAGDSPPAPEGASLILYPSASEAAEVGTGAAIPFVTYFTSSVSGLAKGAPVEVYGIPVGVVTDVGLQMDPRTGEARARVAFEVQPGRLFANSTPPEGTPEEIAQQLRHDGMRAELQLSNVLAGSQSIALYFSAQPGAGAPPAPEGAPSVPSLGNSSGGSVSPRRTRSLGAPISPTAWLVTDPPTELPAASAPAGPQNVPAAPPAQGQAQGPVVLPSQSAGLQNLTQSLAGIAVKLDQLPLAAIGAHLNHTLGTLDQTLASPAVRQALDNLVAATARTRDLVQKTDAAVTPALRRLPEMTATLEATLARANALVGSLGAGYGEGSDIHDEMQRLLVQADQTLRSVRLLSDFLTRHPEALLLGRSGATTK